MAAPSTTTPPPQTPPPPQPQHCTAAARVSLMTAQSKWSPTFRCEVASGLLLLKAAGSEEGNKGGANQEEDGEECVAMVDLKNLEGEAVLCSEQEAGGGEKGRNVVVNMRVGGKALLMRAESEATAGELLAAVAGGRAAAMLAPSSGGGSTKAGGNSGNDRGAGRAAAAAAAAAMRRRKAKDSSSSGGSSGGDPSNGDPVRLVGSYSPVPASSSPGFFQSPPVSAPTPTTPSLARVKNSSSSSSSSNGASPSTAAFVAEQRLLLQQQRARKHGAEERVEVEVLAPPPPRPSREEGKGEEEGQGRQRSVGLVEIIEKSHDEGPASPARSLRSHGSSSAAHHNGAAPLAAALSSVSDSLRSGTGSEELQEGLRTLQAEHRRRSGRSPTAPAEAQPKPRACCSVQ